MRLQKSWFTAVIIAISGVLTVWLLALSLSGGWLSDAPGYPFSVIFAGAWMVLVSLGWSLTRLRTATGYRRIPRIMSAIAASLLVISMVFSSLNLLALSSDRSISYPFAFWLLPLSIILATGAN